MYMYKKQISMKHNMHITILLITKLMDISKSHFFLLLHIIPNSLCLMFILLLLKKVNGHNDLGRIQTEAHFMEAAMANHFKSIHVTMVLVVKEDADLNFIVQVIKW